MAMLAGCVSTGQRCSDWAGANRRRNNTIFATMLISRQCEQAVDGQGLVTRVWVHGCERGAQTLASGPLRASYLACSVQVHHCSRETCRHSAAPKSKRTQAGLARPTCTPKLTSNRSMCAHECPCLHTPTNRLPTGLRAVPRGTKSVCAGVVQACGSFSRFRKRMVRRGTGVVQACGLYSRFRKRMVRRGTGAVKACGLYSRFRKRMVRCGTGAVQACGLYSRFHKRMVRRGTGAAQACGLYSRFRKRMVRRGTGAVQAMRMRHQRDGLACTQVHSSRSRSRSCCHISRPGIHPSGCSCGTSLCRAITQAATAVAPLCAVQSPMRLLPWHLFVPCTHPSGCCRGTSLCTHPCG